MIRGRYVHEVRDMHRHYGPIVRIAPNELSFASPSAWPVLHQRSGARNPFLKNPVFVIKPQNHPVESIPTTTSTEDHERMRGVLEKSFTRGSISLQEPIVQRNIDLMVKQLRDLVDKSGRAGATVDMTDWFSHCAFDVIGDLAFGESFGCLEHGKSHKWVAICTNYIKTLTFATALKYYPWFETFLKRAIPMALLSEIEAKERYHYDHTVHMVKKRLGLEKKKEDIMTAIIEHVGKKNHMAFDEICCNFGFLIVAGSETTTVTLSGILHHLIAAPEVLARLEKEVCGRFQCDTQIVSAVLEKMPYLNAVTHEGLRMCSPVPAGNSRIVPPGGAIVCGEHIPAGVSPCVHEMPFAHSPAF
jgi:cytochrome P450